jgi:hypothetical protein
MAAMSLEPGARFGQYEILDKLGEGGPASVRACRAGRELRRGLAIAPRRMR